MNNEPRRSVHRVKSDSENVFDNINGNQTTEPSSLNSKPKFHTDKTNFHPKKLGHKIKNKHPLTKKEKWIVAGEIAIVALGIVLLIFFILHATKADSGNLPNKKSAKKASVVVTPTINSRLTGLPVNAAQDALPVTAVMIENSTDARPQSGLSQAGVVYEALAEGGITRFMALFEDNQPSSVGPIRSARPYFIDQELPFDAGYAHVGGSPAGLALISSQNVRDLNEFYNGSSFIRLSSRPAPHNVYTSISTLISLEKSKGWTSSSFVGFPRKADSPAKSPIATSITLNPSYSSMSVNYKYNASTNSYDRSEGGSPMIDAANGKQISPKVVIAIVVPWTQGALDASGAYYTDYSDIGNGKAYIFQDGNVTVGEWSKSSITSQIQFGNANGSPMALNAGQTWITALGTTNEVSY